MIAVKRVSPAEIEQLQLISQQTFHETFAADNTSENMAKYLEDNFSLAKLTEEINNPNSEFYFAVSENNVVGYLKINRGPAQTALKDDASVEIERIYVVKELHGKNAGHHLLETALHRAIELNADYIWLGVWEENPRAIAFYRKNGFVEFDKHIFVLGEDQQTDLMMKRKL